MSKDSIILSLGTFSFGEGMHISLVVEAVNTVGLKGWNECGPFLYAKYYSIFNDHTSVCLEIGFPIWS